MMMRVHVPLRRRTASGAVLQWWPTETTEAHGRRWHLAGQTASGSSGAWRSADAAEHFVRSLLGRTAKGNAPATEWHRSGRRGLQI